MESIKVFARPEKQRLIEFVLDVMNQKRRWWQRRATPQDAFDVVVALEIAGWSIERREP